MMVSTKGRYGVRLLLDIALHQDQGTVNLNDIATRQRISSKYLWQVINPLKANGIVRVTRGAYGGYKLAKPPEQINLCQVLDILEGKITVTECARERKRCDNHMECVTREIWAELTDSIRESFSEITLADIIKRARDRIANSHVDFVI
jgi:Rrf2 family protein